MKKNLFIVCLFLCCLNNVNATRGCCSGHGGVGCSRKQSNGNVVCNDGWTGSSCSYSSMVKCSSYSISENSNNDNNSSYSYNNYEKNSETTTYRELNDDDSLIVRNEIDERTEDEGEGGLGTLLLLGGSGLLVFGLLGKNN